ncbi:MAG TPA: ATP-binding protein [Rudaea sp.]|nr:ATP-binding protein [Rudaea sp.]
MGSWRERWRNWWRKPQAAVAASTAVVWHLQVQRERGAVGRLNDRLELNLRPSVPDSALRAVQVALDELLTNAIMHAEQASGAIDMKLARSPGALDVTVSYVAAPFDPTAFTSAATSKSIEDSAIGGHGIRLVRELMDQFRYEYVDGRNILHLRKRC